MTTWCQCRVCGCLVLVLLAVPPLAAAEPAKNEPGPSNPVGWRGDGTGRYEGVAPPTAWSPKGNVAWKVGMPSASNASPILVGDRVFVCAEPSTLLCVSAADGEILWQQAIRYEDLLTAEQRELADRDAAKAAEIHKELKGPADEYKKLRRQSRKSPDDEAIKKRIEELKKEIAEIKKGLEGLDRYQRPRTHKTNGYASPTPTSDGEHVYVLYGTGVAACYELDGTRVWARVVEKPTHGWGHSSSPLLAGGRLVLHIRNLYGLDPATGEPAWQVETRPRWGSPVRTEIDGADVVVTANGDVVRAADGFVIAQKIGKLEYAAPIVHEGVAYFIEHGGVAMRLPDKADGSEKPELLWKTQPRKERYYASVVHHDGLLYAIMQKGVLSVIDAASGVVVYEKEPELGKGTVYPSPALAGGYVYVSGEGGGTVVLQPGRQYREVARNRLEAFRSSPVFRGGRMYVRARTNLYCVGQQPVSRE